MTAACYLNIRSRCSRGIYARGRQSARKASLFQKRCVSTTLASAKSSTFPSIYSAESDNNLCRRYEFRKQASSLRDCETVDHLELSAGSSLPRPASFDRAVFVD
jgi:hypothetical protein